MFRYLSAGESHGRGIFCLLDGIPAGLEICPEDINFWLSERQKGYGRGGRQHIEQDVVDALTGIRAGHTIGAPVLLAVWNKDYENWRDAMDPWAVSTGERGVPVTHPRPAHADLVGAMKYRHTDCRNILERASARETVARVAAGAVCRKLLAQFGVSIAGHVVQIGDVQASVEGLTGPDIHTLAMKSRVRCCDPDAESAMIDRIRHAKEEKDTCGGVVEVRAWNLPPGLGTYTQWDRKLDGRIVQAMVSIQAIKGAEIGIGFRGIHLPGSQFHDEIVRDDTNKQHVGGPYRRTSNNLGGTEGSMTNGEELVVRIAKKPIATLMKPLRSVDMITHEPAEALVERSDTCAVPALAIIAESTLAIVLAESFIDKFGGDSVDEMKNNFNAYLEYIHTR